MIMVTGMAITIIPIPMPIIPSGRRP